MTIDVTSRIEIARPRAVVAAFSADPDNVPRWYVNIKSVEWKTPRPAQVGSRIAFVAQFLGRRLVYTYEIVDLVQGERLVMRTAEGPFPMETSYAWRDTREGATHMALRNRGTPTGFSSLVAPFIALTVRRSTDRDLLRLKNILEAAH
ncbi:SRPBCC family protein [Mesorhizobium argentiipisi]|uniref:SRPBCC family protein n=1 Tax=Mesorhizobium argentiipisi TaxID=3015175 RepID=A0ABU8KI52_9HYPH